MANICSTRIIIDTDSLEESNQILWMINNNFYSPLKDEEYEWIYSLRKRIEEGLFKEYVEERIKDEKFKNLYFWKDKNPSEQELRGVAISSLSSWSWIVRRIPSSNTLMIQLDSKWKIPQNLLVMISNELSNKSIQGEYFVEFLWRWTFELLNGEFKNFKSYSFQQNEQWDFEEIEDK